MNEIITPKFIAKLESLKLNVKDSVAGLFGGNHKNKNKGSSCEFTDYRQYEQGDDIKRIDWSVYARTDNLYIKQYLDERQMHTRIYIDTSTSMTYGEKKKSVYALQLAATLSYLSVKAMDKVSIYAIQNNQCVEIISRMMGKDSFLSQINALNQISFGGDCFISDAICSSPVGYGDGLSIVISDFLTDNDYKRAIDYLKGKKRDVLYIQVLSPEEIQPKYNGRFTLFDSENPNGTFKKNITGNVLKAYQKALEYIQKDISDYCLSRNGEYLFASSGDTLEDFVFLKAYQKGVIQ